LHTLRPTWRIAPPNIILVTNTKALEGGKYCARSLGPAIFRKTSYSPPDEPYIEHSTTEENIMAISDQHSAICIRERPAPHRLPEREEVKERRHKTNAR